MIRPIFLRSVILAAFLCAALMAKAGTVLDFWHSYVPPQTGVKHYSFHVTNYKRGIFFGSCGLSTKSQQWAFSVDLAGEGPAYDSGRINLSDDSAKSLKVVSGQISIDAAQTVATIEITVEQAGVTNKFVANGKYKIKKLK